MPNFLQTLRSAVIGALHRILLSQQSADFCCVLACSLANCCIAVPQKIGGHVTHVVYYTGPPSWISQPLGGRPAGRALRLRYRSPEKTFAIARPYFGGGCPARFADTV